MDDEEFLKFLNFKELKEAYIEEKKQRLYTIEQEFESQKNFLEASKRNSIETDRRHRGMVNVCVAPFTEKGSLINAGYQFIRASPLAEFHIPNVDFLLFKQTQRAKIAILGEAKGSISNPDKIINEFQSRIEIINQKQDYIKANYLKVSVSENVFFEYVLAVPSRDAPDILNRVIEKGSGIVVWHAPITGPEYISVAFPPKMTPNRERVLTESIGEAYCNGYNSS